jgi:hypothetical protein
MHLPYRKILYICRAVLNYFNHYNYESMALCHIDHGGCMKKLAAVLLAYAVTDWKSCR